MEQSKFYQIKNVTEHEYTLVGCDGSVITLPIQEVDKTASVFTIQDAKDGDVLATDDWVFIFEKLNSNGKPTCYCHYDIELGFRIDTNSYIATGSEIYPATKEQHDLLFQKMKEAGYEWYSEKKELKKIEQKPAWNEEDKNMLKWVTEYLNNKMLNTPIVEERTACKNAIAWLEKLKDEQKPADKVEPKFKVGDFIVNDYCMGRIVEITNDAYLLDTEQGIPFSSHSIRLWDITKDAKDGDVLCCESGWTCIFKALNSDIRFSSYCFMDGTGWFCGTGSESHTLDKAYNGNIYPATKEQRDTLMKAMADAGYTFDFEKKELKKIEQKPAEWTMDNIEELTEFENAMMHIGGSFFGEHQGLDPNDTFVVKEQAKILLEMAPKQEWSAKDENFLNTTIAYLRDAYSKDKIDFKDTAKNCVNWLKSLKGRVQPKNEWSEEDEKMIESLTSQLYRISTNTRTDSTSPNYTFYNEINWLKSIRPQNRWKPDSSMLTCLEYAIKHINKDGDKKILSKLLEQLKKLKEEQLWKK